MNKTSLENLVKHLKAFKKISLKNLVKYLKAFKKIKNFSFEERKKLFLISFIAFPVFFSTLYFYSIGRNRYFVRSDIIVRKASSSSRQSLDISNLIGTGNSSSTEDAMFLRTYLESPQVLKAFENVVDIEKVYTKLGLDFYSGISKNPSFEEKYDFFRRQISISLDDRSGILRIRSLALDPNTAYKLNTFLIDQAELFINQLNQSVYKEQLEFLNKEVLNNEKKLNEANIKLTEFQRFYQTLDVKSEAAMNSSLIAELESELVKLKVELASIKRQFVDPNSPEIKILNDQILELNNQIKIERNSLVNPKGKDYSNRIVKMSELKSNQEFAYNLYMSALTAAEKATLESIQQQRFLGIISEPQMPEKEWRNWRHRGYLTTLSIFIIFVSLTKFLLGMADSHNN